jgi:hypothetical protein
MLLSVGILLLSPTDSLAQWQPDVRLTNNPDPSYTSWNNAWCITASGNFVHVVWYDDRDGDEEIYYKRSTDGGVSWGADTRLTNNTALSDNPSVAVSGSVVHVVWYDDRDGNREIYYKRSTDGGVSWGSDTRLTNNPGWSVSPSVALSGSVVHVVWEDLRDGNEEVYYKRSTDAGASWGTDTWLTMDTMGTDASFDPSVAVSGSVVHVVWYDYRAGNVEIYYKRSTDAGVSWGADTRLTSNLALSVSPTVAVFGSVVHVVWREERDGNGEIYYKRSTDAGVSWGADTRLTNNPDLSVSPSVAVSGSVVHVVWYDYRDGNEEIYYKRSTDMGVSWGADTRLTTNTALSRRPSVAVSGSAVHVVWSDFRDGNFEIYYMGDPTGNPVVGVQMIGSEVPQEFTLAQNYPNPFNPGTAIGFQLTAYSHARLSIYDLLGREVATLVNEVKAPGTYEVKLDGSGIASGVYLYRLTAGNQSVIRKMMVTK